MNQDITFTRRSFLRLGIMSCVLPFLPDVASHSLEDLLSPYGKIVYQQGTHRSHQLYILGQKHIDPLDGSFDKETIKSQQENFEIGRILVEQAYVQTLFIEGVGKGD